MSQVPDIILDAHLDIAFNHVAFGRDFKAPSWLTYRREYTLPPNTRHERGIAVVGMPDMLLGRVGVAFVTLWVAPIGQTLLTSSVSYETPYQAYQQALKQLDYYHRLADEDDRIRLIRTQSELEAVLDSWQPQRDFAEHKLGLVILMEGADPVLEPKQIEEWVERGVRIVGLAWRATRYSAGTGEPGRLTKLGRELLEVMASFKLILDLSHMAELAYYEALDSYDGVLLASHSNPRRFVNTDRHLSDDMIRRLAERDGVVGLVPYNAFIKMGWRRWRDPKTAVNLNHFLDMIDHVCQVTGSAQHVGIGTDWDSCFGWESIPAPLDSHLDLWRLRHALSERYDQEDVHNILCGNFLRLLRRGLPT